MAAEEGIEGVQLQAKEPLKLPANHQELERYKDPFSPTGLTGPRAPQFGTSGLQKCEIINFCHPKTPVCSTYCLIAD